jgi:nucleotide-binding universal stress UspA family protein
MFEKILMTLDGSELSESSIPYVRHLAVQLEAETYLLHVCPPEHQCFLHMHQMYMNTIAAALRRELNEGRSPDKALKVNAETVVGESGKIILDYIKLRNISLTVLTTHGTSGLRPWSMGRIANRIVREADIPTLLIRIKENPSNLEKKGLVRKILVPLENSEASKIAVPYAMEMAKKLKAGIILFGMARTIYSQNIANLGTGVGGGFGVNWDELDKVNEKVTDDFLQAIENDLIKNGVEASHTVYLGLDAAEEILQMEKKTGADMVVMATRARSPAARWVFGSTAEKVLRQGDRPIMFIRERAE